MAAQWSVGILNARNATEVVGDGRGGLCLHVEFLSLCPHFAICMEANLYILGEMCI